MVVPVLMTSCQVSEKPNSGPVTSQTTMTSTASAKAQELPVQAVTWRDQCPALVPGGNADAAGA